MLADIYLYIVDSIVSIHRELGIVIFYIDLKKRGISMEDEKHSVYLYHFHDI